MLLDEAHCRRAIGEAFPALAITSLRYFAVGWDYELWEVNGDLLFRFPLREECAPPLLVEARLLAALQGHVSIAIPQPLFVSEGCPAFPMPFFAYRKLPGVPLDQTALDVAGRRAIARQIGGFLSELHSFPIDQAAALGVRVRAGGRWRERYVNLHERAREKMGPLLSAGEAQSLEAFWDGFLGRAEHFAFTPALIHCDLAPEHILIDEDGARVTGVIDFGDVLVGDPALDFAGVEADFREDVLRSYAGSADETFRERAEIYRSRISPIYAVLHGLSEGLPEWVDRGLEGIRRQST
jgi:aminoglycoside 2''-phosphotransferase